MFDFRIAFVLSALALALVRGAEAQILDPLWEGPERLSTYEGFVRDRAVTVDRRGHALACWLEERLHEESFFIYCRWFDGKAWSPAVIVEEAFSEHAGAISRFDIQIDRTNTVQMVFSGAGGPVYHRRVSAEKAMIFNEWSGFIDIPISVIELRLVVDVQGGMVLLYTRRPHEEFDEGPGVFAMRSTDNGDTWSDPVRIDAGSPPGWTAKDLEADFDGSNTLHVVWNYLGPNNWDVVEVKTARSTDGGKTWSVPVALESLAGADPEFNPSFIRLAIPEIKAHGPNVHVTYAGGGDLGIRRRHVYSTDSGATWTEPAFMMGTLEGAAGTDSMLVDSLGRFHLLAQVRYPQGIYHTMWTDGAWTDPELIYLIAEHNLDVIGPRVHAQYFEASINPEDHIVLLVETCADGCPDDSTWPQNPITFGLTTIAPLGKLPSVTTVSSATFTAGQPVAAESIVSGFSVGLSQDVKVASSTPLPKDLDGVRVDVIDILGDGRPAGLQFVSPEQINFVVPEPTYPGSTRVRVYRRGQIIAAGRVNVSKVSPAIYTVNGQGTGVAAATWLFVGKDGSRASGLIFDPATGQPIPVDFDAVKGDLYISLFGTGIRHFREHVRAEIGDLFVPVLSVGPQGEFEGLDQINLGPLPAQLSVGAVWDTRIFVDGVEANRTVFVTQDRP